MHRAMYAKAFFDLQLRFAHAVGELSGLPLPSVLLDYTNLYVRFGLGRDFRSEHPIWQAYLAGLQKAGDHCEWTYRFYRERAASGMEGVSIAATFGCFSYGVIGEERIRLHFRNADSAERSPLGSSRIPQRRADLTALFTHAQRTLPEHTRVVGASWLYNLEAYRRLLPVAYVSMARAVHDRFRFMSLWGQFLDRRGGVRESMASLFLKRLEEQASIERLHECFPFQVLAVEAPVREFYEFYGV